MPNNPFDEAGMIFDEASEIPKATWDALSRRSAGSQGVVFHRDLEQGTEEWFAARCGLLTASEMKFIVTPATMKACDNDKSRAHLWELLAQRITSYVEPHYIGDEMLRGYEDEIEVCRLYSEKFEPVDNGVGFITNDRWGFTLGYSPDGLVGEHGQLEAKSRRQKFHVQAVVENVVNQSVPAEFLVQVQTGLVVSERQWCDFIVFTGGLPMIPIRVHPDPVVADAIINIAGGFETKMKNNLQLYMNAIAQAERLVPTERKVEQEMVI